MTTALQNSRGDAAQTLRLVPVTSDEGSSLSQRYANAPAAPPSSGATQNSQSCAIAQPPTNSAGPVLRAGFTDVLVTGIETRWINVSASPMASGANPAGALPCVAPMMMNRNMAVITNSVSAAAPRPYLPGECSA